MVEKRSGEQFRKLRVCLDSYENKVFAGRLYHPALEGGGTSAAPVDGTDKPRGIRFQKNVSEGLNFSRGGPIVFMKAPGKKKTGREQPAVRRRNVRFHPGREPVEIVRGAGRSAERRPREAERNAQTTQTRGHRDE